MTLKHRIRLFEEKLPPELRLEFIDIITQFIGIVLSRSSNAEMQQIGQDFLPPEYKPQTEILESIR